MNLPTNAEDDEPVPVRETSGAFLMGELANTRFPAPVLPGIPSVRPDENPVPNAIYLSDDIGLADPVLSPEGVRLLRAKRLSEEQRIQFSSLVTDIMWALENLKLDPTPESAPSGSAWTLFVFARKSNSNLRTFMKTHVAMACRYMEMELRHRHDMENADADAAIAKIRQNSKPVIEKEPRRGNGKANLDVFSRLNLDTQNQE